MSTPASGADRVTRGLFSTEIDEFKARRAVIPSCPECGRRGYHLKVCRRVHLATGLLSDLPRSFSDVEFRWLYLARLLYQRGVDVRFSDTRRGDPFKRGRMP
jgi:hypothetical protein